MVKTAKIELFKGMVKKLSERREYLASMEGKWQTPRHMMGDCVRIDNKTGYFEKDWFSPDEVVVNQAKTSIIKTKYGLAWNDYIERKRYFKEVIEPEFNAYCKDNKITLQEVNKV